MKITIEEIRKFLKDDETKLTFEKLTNFEVYIIREISDEFLRVEFESIKNSKKTNKKRIFFSEVVDLVNNTYKNKIFYRNDFETFCPKTKSDGGCGYSVIIRLLEKLNKGKYLGRGKGFEFNNL
jgi:hypothetical protein